MPRAFCDILKGCKKTFPLPSLKGKGDRVSGGRVCHSGMSVTVIVVLLKREGEGAEDLYLGRCRRLGFIGRRGYGFAITPLSLRDISPIRGISSTATGKRYIKAQARAA